MIFTSPDSILERDTRPKDQGLKKDFGDTTVQDCSTPQQQRPPARSKRCLVTDGTPIKCAWNGPLATVLRYGKGPSREEAAAGRVCLRGTKIFLEHFLSITSLEERSSPSSFRQAFRHTDPAKLPPSSARRQSPWSRVPQFPLSPSMLHPSAAVSPGQQDWTDLVRADRLKAQDGHPLELLKRIKGRIDGAVPARKVEGQDTTPGPASAEQDFAGEEPEAVVEDLAGGVWAVGGR